MGERAILSSYLMRFCGDRAGPGHGTVIRNKYRIETKKSKGLQEGGGTLGSTWPQRERKQNTSILQNVPF